MFLGKPLFEGARGGPSVRLQAEEVKDVRVRGLRAHHRRARDPLPPPQGQPPLLPSTTQVLRQATLQVQQLQLCQHAATVQYVSLNTELCKLTE